MSELGAPTAEAPPAATRDGAAPEVVPDGPRDDRVVVIRPVGRLPRLELREVWHFRELFAALVWRDVSVRYKQTLIGAAWAIVQPFLLMVVMTLVFGKFAQFPTDGTPYPIFLYSGLLPWTLFAGAVTLASASVVSNRNLVTKVYFPRVILPVAAVLVPLVDFALAFVVLAGMWLWFGIFPTAWIVVAPLFLLLVLATALGVGMWLSALNVRYRDVPFVVPFLVNIWFWLTPVTYATSPLEQHYQWLLALNPMTAVVEGFRWTLLGSAPPEAGQLAVSVTVAIALVTTGLAFFRASEPRFADAI